MGFKKKKKKNGRRISIHMNKSSLSAGLLFTRFVLVGFYIVTAGLHFFTIPS